MLEESLALEEVEVGQSDGAGDGVAAPGVAVEEGVGAVTEGLEEPITGDHGAGCGVARCHALGAGDDVGLHAEALDGEHVADTPERRDGLVGDEEHVVLIADLSHSLEVTGWGREAPA